MPNTRVLNSELRINGDRLWARLEELALIGATPAGGVRRLALSATDSRARDWFQGQAEQIGLVVSIDGIGNMFARREGTDARLLPVLLGSHLDSQPTGGRFDGPLGVLAALEAVETLNDHEVITPAPIEIVNWTNEEGARFPPAMMGSGVFSGRFSIEDAMASVDPDGITVADAIDKIGYRGPHPIGKHCLGAALELHIEQGPILEERGCDIGVVTGVQGTRWFDLTIRGEETHAGPTPMARRTDPVAVLGSALVSMYHRVEGEFSPDGRLTFGVISTKPASRNTVPGEVTLTVDIRHPRNDGRDALEACVKEEVAAACALRNAKWDLKTVWASVPIQFSDRCLSAISEAADGLGYSTLELMAGAGHDSVHTADVAPTGMIFVPCKNGVSHNESESITFEQAEAGANVLLHAALTLANPNDR